MKKLIILVGLILFIMVGLNAETQSGLKVWGSNFIDLSAYHYLNNESDSIKFGAMNTFRFNFHNRNKRYGKIEGNFDLIIPFGYTADQFHSLIDQTKASDSLSMPYYPLFIYGNTPVLLDIRKLYVSLYLPFADITIGRQIINYGKGIVFSPIDVFSTVDVTNINFERHGSDVAVIKIPFSFLSGLDVVTELPRKNHEYSTALRGYFNTMGFDIALNTIYKHRSEEMIAGLSFKGDAFFGVYGEFVEHFANDYSDRYFEGMLGLDYSIANTYFFTSEYYYKNSNIQNEWGKHNLFLSFKYVINDLMNVSAHVIGSDVGGDTQRLMYMGQFYYNILQNVDVITYARYFSYKQDNDTLPDLEYAVRVEVKF
ncbi:MAG: hypothetical protein P9L89_01975 [Candidatus Celaenobacter polaris]|nr:hypothetical protein [Candidatus Celaenobacter polaris]